VAAAWKWHVVELDELVEYSGAEGLVLEDLLLHVIPTSAPTLLMAAALASP
jgi:hypothetical protein